MKTRNPRNKTKCLKLNSYDRPKLQRHESKNSSDEKRSYS